MSRLLLVNVLSVSLLIIITSNSGCFIYEGPQVIVSSVALSGGRTEPPIDAHAVRAILRGTKVAKLQGMVEKWTKERRSIVLSSTSTDSIVEFVSVARSGITQIVVSGSLDCRDGCDLDAGTELKYSLIRESSLKLEARKLAVVCVIAYASNSIEARAATVAQFAMSIFDGTCGDSLPPELEDITFVIYSVSTP